MCDGTGCLVIERLAKSWLEVSNFCPLVDRYGSLKLDSDPSSSGRNVGGGWWYIRLCSLRWGNKLISGYNNSGKEWGFFGRRLRAHPHPPLSSFRTSYIGVIPDEMPLSSSPSISTCYGVSSTRPSSLTIALFLCFLHPSWIRPWGIQSYPVNSIWDELKQEVKRDINRS
ncbi:hypothetical protein Tco_0730875 [Tanacetum coccineum]